LCGYEDDDVVCFAAFAFAFPLSLLSTRDNPLYDAGGAINYGRLCRLPTPQCWKKRIDWADMVDDDEGLMVHGRIC